MSPELLKIVERIQKLLNLAGNNPNENEAAQAVEKAYAILAEHNLTLAEVQAHGAKEIDAKREQMHTDTTFSEIYYRQIWNAVAKAHYCHCYSTRPSPKARQTIYTLTGREINVLVATQLAMYLCQTVRRLTNEAAKGQDHTYKNSFLVGCAYRLCERVAALKLDEAKQQNALVLWTGAEEEANRQFLATKGIKLRPAKAHRAKVNMTGYSKGQAAGDGISLSQQVGASARNVERTKLAR